MSACYRELSASLVAPTFIRIIRDFPVLLFVFLLCKWLWISGVHNRVIQLTCLIFITSLLIWRRDNILLADFRILTICIINLYILQAYAFGFNLGIDSTTKYFLLSGYVMQLLKINL